MLKDKITVRVQSRFRSLRKDHGTPFLQKCRRAREILSQVYEDRELCITENLIRRSDYLRGRSLWRRDEYYTETFELDLIDARLEAMIAGAEPPEPSCAAPREESAPPREKTPPTLAQTPQASLPESATEEGVPAEGAQEEFTQDEPEACLTGQ